MHRMNGVQEIGTGATQWVGAMAMSGNDWCPDWYWMEEGAAEKVAERTAGIREATTELADRLCCSADKVDDVRWELVARLRREIAAGTYRIDATEVAGSMMRALGACD